MKEIAVGFAVGPSYGSGSSGTDTLSPAKYWNLPLILPRTKQAKWIIDSAFTHVSLLLNNEGQNRAGERNRERGGVRRVILFSVILSHNFLRVGMKAAF